MAALLYACHPLHSEMSLLAVRDQLLVVILLAGLLIRRRSSGAGAAAASAALFLAALLCKETGLLAPVIWLADDCAGGRWRLSRRDAAAAIGVLAVYVLLRSRSGVGAGATAAWGYSDGETLAAIVARLKTGWNRVSGAPAWLFLAAAFLSDAEVQARAQAAAAWRRSCDSAEKGDWRLALEQAEAASRLDPSLAWAQRQRATLLWRLDRRAQAHDAYADCRRALESRPYFARASCACGGEAEEADLLAEATDARRAFSSGLKAYASGKYEEAARRLGEAARLDPSRADAQLSLGVALDRLGRWRQALAAYDAAVAIAEKDAAVSAPEFVRVESEPDARLLRAALDSRAETLKKVPRGELGSARVVPRGQDAPEALP